MAKKNYKSRYSKSDEYIKGFKHGFYWTYTYLKNMISCLEEDRLIKYFNEAVKNLKNGR